MPHPHRRKTLIACTLLALAASATLFAQGTLSSLEERMSYKEFKEYGLDKLSPEQLRGLNDWLRAHGASGVTSVATTRPAAATAASGAAPATDADGAIVSRLAGDFSGWRQGTVLTLQNGQRWEVRDDETVYGHGDHNPEITVAQRSLIGGWTLTVEGYNDIAHVLPVKK
jgi:hypothetical protein